MKNLPRSVRWGYSREVTLTDRPFAFVGVLHLPPLPGSPRPGPGLAAVIDHALRDAEALAEGGAHGCIVENLGDAPFGVTVEPHVGSMLAVIAAQVRQRFPHLVVGINALRNDPLASLGAAAASDSHFVRINVHSGAMVTDQGLIQGRARETLLYRNRLGSSIGLVCDVLVKHAAPLAFDDAVQLARDTARRGGADVLVVTGSGTGQPVDVERLRTVAGAVPEVPTWVGSGTTLDTFETVRTHARGAIVGTALHRNARLDQPLDVDVVRAFAAQL